MSGTLDITCKKCDKPDHVCCRKPDKKLQECAKIIRATDANDPEPNEEFIPEEDWSQCGRNASGSLVITGVDDSYEGNQFEAQPGEFPHACIIFTYFNGYRNYIGGATLIAPNKLLTVAHKFWNT